MNNKILIGFANGVDELRIEVIEGVNRWGVGCYVKDERLGESDLEWIRNYLRELASGLNQESVEYCIRDQILEFNNDLQEIFTDSVVVGIRFADFINGYNTMVKHERQKREERQLRQ